MATSIHDANSIVSGLVSGWCEREAVGALRILLPAWPHNGLTDGIVELADALRGVRARAKDELLESELDQLSRALAVYDQSVSQA